MLLTNKWTPMVPDDFVLPLLLETDKYKLKPLTVDEVDKDYEAVMSSRDDIRGTFSIPGLENWPQIDLSREEDLSNLGWHQTEFSMRTSFAYTVVSLDDTLCLGCVYIFPSIREGADAEIYLWVRTSHRYLDQQLFQTVKQWIRLSWPFKEAIFPGRKSDD